ncbi:N-acetyltransferase [Marinifilum sp. D714]|uniref:GNAT family N-acetyltransferase n=1 Tax=Marinifilum sp. D714 TaxID=2937523 RepID=UPI0027BD5D72|nr:N-acetyltransferase [Marinifilum sp. D714]MDQ2179367.1 GNAT family N-acetyltransferase [Marinifilum sp. D714]
MRIRKARAEDSGVIASYMMLAMEDIVYGFIGENSFEKAIQLIECLVRKEANQYSYENCWIVEENKQIVAVANIYDGGSLYDLRKPVADQIKVMFNREFNPEDETQNGEFYIDCIGVNPDWQGKGLGTKLLQFLIEEYVCKKQVPIGLLVDNDNPKAKRLYLNLGFEIIGSKILAGKNMEHLQIKKYSSQSSKY